MTQVRGSIGLVAAAVLAVSASMAVAQDEDPALDLYYAANELCKPGSYPHAVAYYTEFLGKYGTHPKAPKAKLGLGLALYNLKQYDKAAPVLAPLLGAKDIEQQTLVHNLHGMCMLELGEAAKAEGAFAVTAADAKDPQWENAQVGLTEALYRQAKWEKALAASEALLEKAPKSAFASRVRFQGAVSRFELKQYAKAVTALKEVLDDKGASDFHQHVQFLLGESKTQLNDLVGAAKDYATAAAGTGRFAGPALYRLGLTHFTLKDYAASAQALTQYVGTYKESKSLPQANLYLGQAHLMLKNYAGAAAALTPLTTGTDLAVATEAAVWLARTYARQNNAAQAEAVAQPLVTKLAGANTPSAELLFEYADALMVQNKLAPAAEAFDKTIAAGPAAPTAAPATWLGAYCRHQLKEYPASLKLCEAYLGAFPQEGKAADVLFLKGENLLLSDSLEESLKAYQKFADAYGKHEYADKATMRIGMIHYRAGRYKDASDALAPLCKNEKLTEPVFDSLWFLVGDSLFQLKQWDAAVTALEKFVAAKPGQPNVDTALFRLGLAYQEKKEPAKAIERLTTLVNGHPKSVHLEAASVELGRLYYEAKNYPAANQALAKVAETPHGLYYLGWVALAQEKLPEAGTHFSMLLAKHPKHSLAADAALQYGILLTRLTPPDYAKAVTVLTAFLGENGKTETADQAAFYLGLAQARLKQTPAALAAFQNLLTTYKTSKLCDRALYEMAWCQRDAGKPAEAMKHYGDLLASYSESALAPAATVELAELEYKAQQYAPAISRLEKIQPSLKDKDLLRRAGYWLGWCYFATEKYGPAAKAFEASLADVPSNDTTEMTAIACYQAGESRFRQNEYVPAIPLLARAVSTAQKAVHKQALFRLGECQGLDGKWGESLNNCQAFLQAYGDDPLAIRALFGKGWALENQNQHAAAIPVYKEVVAKRRRDETSSRAQFQIGECHYALKQYDEAIRELALVEANSPFENWKSVALLEMGRALRDMGRVNDAVARFQQVIEKYPKSQAAARAKSLLEKPDKEK